MNLNKIRKIATDKKISLRDLAVKSKISEQGLHSILRRNNCSLENLENIANALNVPISYFLDDYKEPEKPVIILKQTEINIRLKKIMHNAELNQIQFAGRIGITPERLNKILNNNLDFGIEVIQGLAKAFPEINLRWVLLGVDEMERKITMAAEPSAHYGKPCKQCAMKDKIITDLLEEKQKLKIEIQECRAKLQTPREKRKVS